MRAVRCAIRRLANGAGLDLPDYASKDAAGMDLRAAEDVAIKAGRWALVPTGFAIALPQGYEAQLRPRSGLAARHGVTLLNSPGTVDADYRGEIKVILINHGSDDVAIRRGERITQMVVAPVVQARWEEQASLDDTVRGEEGFGSTGQE
jgi:dUTP pyrophosphatase